MKTKSPVDVDVLRGEIRKTYTDVSTDQEQEFIFPTGRGWAQELGYPEPDLSRVPDATVDVVISNGVIDLVPDKDAVFDEIDRVLRPGGRLQIADVIIHTEVSEDARKRIDLWTG